MYVTGVFNSPSINFYNSNGDVEISLNNTTSTSDNDTYIAKYDTDGTLLWARVIGGTGSDMSVSACIGIIESPIFKYMFFRRHACCDRSRIN